MDVAYLQEIFTPNVGTVLPSPLLDSNQDDDMDILFTSAPRQQEPRMNRNRSTRRMREVSGDVEGDGGDENDGGDESDGGGDSSRDTSPSDNSSRRKAKDSSANVDQVSSMIFTPPYISKVPQRLWNSTGGCASSRS